MYRRFPKIIKSNKAQVSLEAIIAISALLVLFSTIVFVTIDKEIFIRESDESLSRIAVCYKIANSIESVYSTGENTQTKISFPDTKDNVMVFGGGMIYVGDLSSPSAQSCDFPSGIANNSGIQLPGTIGIIRTNNTVFLKKI